MKTRNNRATPVHRAGRIRGVDRLFARIADEVALLLRNAS